MKETLTGTDGITSKFHKNIFSRYFCSAVILAGGSGQRMESEITKQMMDLGGMPVVARTLAIFDSCDMVDEIVVVARENEIPLYNDFISKYNFKKIKSVVFGGKTRQESAFNGMLAVSDDATHIAFHDAARCLVTDDIIRRVILAARKYKAASAAAPVTDTIKIVTPDLKTQVKNQPQRDKLWAVQTPQAFDANLYRAGAYTAKKDNYTGTDDCSLAEYVGFSCRLIDCGNENLKITTPVDLYTAQAIIARRSGKE